MGIVAPIWHKPTNYIAKNRPEDPILFLDPAKLRQTAERFLQGFPGFVTYATKANPHPTVIDTLSLAGIRGFDVASPAEIDLVQSMHPGAALHYNNPVRSSREIDLALGAGVRSYSIDSLSELKKIAAKTDLTDYEISVRFALDIKGASYDFGSKFGASPVQAIDLLMAAKRLGARCSLTFHPGTQCIDANVWRSYILKAADIAKNAAITLYRLNVGGGFPSLRDGQNHDLERIFHAISSATKQGFGDHAPALVCEPGRAMVADAMTLALSVKAVRHGRDVFLCDGIYGTLGEQNQIGLTRQTRVIGPDGQQKDSSNAQWRVFGPTCDSLDVLDNDVALPHSLAEGDTILFGSMGAYSQSLGTRFNGYGNAKLVTVQSLS